MHYLLLQVGIEEGRVQADSRKSRVSYFDQSCQQHRPACFQEHLDKTKEKAIDTPRRKRNAAPTKINLRRRRRIVPDGEYNAPR
jgi:hypothetical protein